MGKCQDIREPTAISFRGLRPSSEVASRVKALNRSRGTRHEELLCRALRKLGRRFRRNVETVAGVPDIVFRGAKVAVFCDGDFWHGRNWTQLKRALARRHNCDYWIAKIARNRARDRQVTRELTRSGWIVVRYWEGDILWSPETLSEAVGRIVAERLKKSCVACPSNRSG
jgi:DNA mismatch endonuclease (patch repair protein)